MASPEPRDHLQHRGSGTVPRCGVADQTAGKGLSVRVHGRLDDPGQGREEIREMRGLHHDRGQC